MRKRYWLFAILMTSLSFVVLTAQTEACVAFVEEVLDSVAENCEDLARNQACYGNNRLRAAFQDPAADDFFTQPSNLAELTTVSTLETLPYTPTTEEWGIAVLNVQANVPNSLPGQAVTFMLMGDTQVENQVVADDAFSPADGVAVRAVAGTNFRSGPSLNFNVVSTSGTGGADYIADVLSEDGEWLRIVEDDTPLWVFRELINNEPAEVEDLPTLTTDLRTPMQAIYFTSGVGQDNCQEAPNSLVIQSAPTMEVVLDINGLNITHGSTSVYQFVESNVIQVRVFEGVVEFNDSFTIPVGATAFVRTEDDGTLIPDSWFGFRTLTDEEYDQFFWMQTYETRYFRPLGTFVRDIVATTSCDSFIRTSPIGELITSGFVDFFWNPPSIPAITQYQVLFYDENNRPTDQFFVDGQTNNIRLDVGQLKTGAVLRWEVLAYAGDEIICTTPVGTFQVRDGGNSQPEEITENEPRDDEDDDGGGGKSSCTAAAGITCP